MIQMPHIFSHLRHETLESETRLDTQPAASIITGMGLKGTELILDVGAGIGYVSLPLARDFQQSTVFSMDLQHEMSMLLHSRIMETGLDNVSGITGTVHTIPFQPGSMDVVFMVNVFHELEDLPKAMSEIRRILRPGGTFWVVDFQKINGSFGPPIEERFSPVEVEQLVKDASPSMSLAQRHEHHEWYQLGFRRD